MKTRQYLRLASVLAALFFTLGEADARVVRRRAPYRPPARPAAKPAPAPKPVVPKTVEASGLVMGIFPGSKSLMILDDTTHVTASFVLAPESKFFWIDKEVKPEAFKTHSHVTVSYQDTDRTVKEVRLSPPKTKP